MENRILNRTELCVRTRLVHTQKEGKEHFTSLNITAEEDRETGNYRKIHPAIKRRFVRNKLKASPQATGYLSLSSLSFSLSPSLPHSQINSI